MPQSIESQPPDSPSVDSPSADSLSAKPARKVIQDAIARTIGTLREDHLIIEGIWKEYIEKPTLVYITFWDADSLIFHSTHPRPKGNYGGVPVKHVNCIVENYDTAFAPLFTSLEMKRLYEKYRTPQPLDARGSGHLSTYPLYKKDGKDGELKPIDFHFLENFHKTNNRNLYTNSEEITHLTNPLDWNPAKDNGLQWWPHLVVRLEEIFQVLDPMDLDSSSSTFAKLVAYQQFFGILISYRVRLQDYFILINRKTENDEARDYYQQFERRGDPRYNQLIEEAIKGYDVKGKLPTDLTFASLDDFDGEQRMWGIEVERFFVAWDTVLKPVNAFFVRWKTASELEAEDQKLAEQVEPRLKDETQKVAEQIDPEDAGEKLAAKSVEVISGDNPSEVLRRSPLRGFTRSVHWVWREYNRLS
jgi:hypothetical protein